MKHLIFVCLIALISCSTEEEVQPKQTSFDSIVGEWTFQDKDVFGEVFVAEFSDNLVVDNKGSFTIKGVEYTILERGKITPGFLPGTLQSIYLLHPPDVYIGMHEGTINSEFTEIVFKKYSYGVSSGVFFTENSKITLKRK